MKKTIWLIALLLLVSQLAYSDNLFRWKDKEGKVHYGDKPAEDAIGAEQKKFESPLEPGDDDLSYGTRKAKQDFPVKLYVANNCGDLCVQARSMLSNRGIPYSEKNLITEEDYANFKRLTGGNGVPVLTIGKTVLSGFAASQWNNELDIVGYPKVAPYGKRPTPTPAAQPGNPAATEK